MLSSESYELNNAVENQSDIPLIVPIPQSSRVLFVDDEPAVLESLRRILRPQSKRWDMRFVGNIAQALEVLVAESIDTVVSDMRMPGGDGLDLIRAMRENDGISSIPVIILTGMNDRELTRQAIDLGALDLIHKPADSVELIARIQSALRIKASEDALKRENRSLETEVRRRTAELTDSRQNLVWRLAKAAEYRDSDTGNHVVRVACYSRVIAKALGLDAATVEQIFLTAPLHDVGKIGIPDAILLKNGPLTNEEWTIMKRHCVIGDRILRESSKAAVVFHSWQKGNNSASSSDDPLIKTACSIALCHHEKWDGSGYPHGLSGESIPLPARVVAMSDVYDALTSSRPYKAAFAEEKALSIIHDGVGRHFDPQVFHSFEKSLNEIRQIRQQLQDDPAKLAESNP